MILHIKVKPGSSRDEILEEADGYKVKIKAQPVEGKANKYLIKYLSKVLEVPASGIEIIKGLSGPFKTISIEATEEYVDQKLRAATH